MRMVKRVLRVKRMRRMRRVKRVRMVSTVNRVWSPRRIRVWEWWEVKRRIRIVRLFRGVNNEYCEKSERDEQDKKGETNKMTEVGRSCFFTWRSPTRPSSLPWPSPGQTLCWQRRRSPGACPPVCVLPHLHKQVNPNSHWFLFILNRYW